MTAITEAVARPARTGVQLGAAEVIVAFIEAFIADLSTEQHVALLALLTLLIGAAQVLLENHYGTALLRRLPPRDVPVVTPPKPYSGDPQ